MNFSRRTAWEPGLSEWAATVEAAARERSLIDLTVANPTSCGLALPAAMIKASFAQAEYAPYVPHPLGMLPARAAVTSYYGQHGVTVPVENLCLTTSTSEAYSFLFRLMGDPGDEVLIARPSYPLLDLLAGIDDLCLREYELLHEPGGVAGADSRWALDLASLEASITPRTRAVIAVHPNNPTGHYVAAQEREALVAMCAARGLALVVDEVFLDYRLDGATTDAKTFAAETGCLCFVLSGLSKVCALPQMKASWIAASGPESELREAMRRLEIIADTFLSLSAPIQEALPAWLAQRKAVQDDISVRLRENLAALDRRLVGTLGSRYGVEGGWTVVLRVPRFVNGESFPEAALHAGVLVQPGTLYGLPAGRCVLSLLTEPSTWREGLQRLPL